MHVDGHHLGKAEIHVSFSSHIIFHFNQGTRTLVLLAKNILCVKLLQASDSGDLGCGFHFLTPVSAFISATCFLFIIIFYLILCASLAVSQRQFSYRVYVYVQ